MIVEGTSCSENLVAMVTRNNNPTQMLCFDVVFYLIRSGFFSADLTFENSFSFKMGKFFVCFLHHRPYRVVKILENLREIRRILWLSSLGLFISCVFSWTWFISEMVSGL